jgi:hypothetical protein
MQAGTMKSVVDVEVAEGAIHIIPPEQLNRPAAEPHAFRITGRPTYQTRGFGELLDPPPGLLGRFGGLGRGRLFAPLGIAALGKRRHRGSHQGRRNEGGEEAVHAQGHIGWLLSVAEVRHENFALLLAPKIWRFSGLFA